MVKDIVENFNKVKKEIKSNLKKSNRGNDKIDLVAVGKNHPPKKIIKILKNGHKLFGENKVQELLDKHELFYDQDVSWHFIGHLQKNKVKYLLKIDQLEMIESVDSIEIAKIINKEAQSNNRVIQILLQVNIADDSDKYGFKRSKIEAVLKKLIKLKNIEIRGLMTITPYYNEPEKARDDYNQMKKLFDEMNNKGYKLSELSMGMSNDYQIAIQEGATIIRVGTAIFGKRNYY
ncbi:MAG: YggS family pyridoxal phosphate-dependent enzyme [Halanaerobiales bacterium]|nr:YggS family pyridoxal phosphate-dependent enzyme [Halanaerobiales bacterium]